MKGKIFSRREPVKTFLLEMWGQMDPGPLSSVCKEWINRVKYFIESGEEYYTKNSLARLLTFFVKIEGGSTTF
jgi:hypothetical protein